ncbi:MAG: zinc carboxypeptidase, partial [Myxococcales bacterium]|nr:zinc carboxypeptidase [Myxococcales bacterium]
YKMHSEKIITTSVLNENAVKDFSFLAATMDFPSRDEKFHTYDEMYEDLKALESEYPDLASVFSIGKSVLGKDIWGIKISGKRSEAEELVPAIAYLGTHHAREHLSTEMPIMLAQKLLDEYHLDGNIKNLIDGNEVYIIPMVNPDGAMYDIEGGRYKSWRKNRRSNANGSYGVDLNRNYGYGWGTGGSSSNPYSEVYMGESAFSEPETQAVKEFFLAHENITIALSFHTFSELILYPWGGLYEGVGGEDEAIFKKMATDMAQMNHYDPMQSSELYIASGDTCDWLYGELNVFCFTFELSPSSIWGGGFYPGASVIDTVFDDNWEPILYLLDRAADPRSALDL